MADSLKKRLLTDDALAFIHKALGAGREEISDIEPTEAGMTNRSFRFCCRGTSYILRVPGEGTDKLISRAHEYDCYAALQGNTLTDHVLAFDRETGYKLSEFWPETRNCDPSNWDEVQQCMDRLREFHEMRMEVAHEFRLDQEIARYEQLRGGPSEYPDYEETRGRCMGMREFLMSLPTARALTHVDAVPDNFLFVQHPDGEKIHLIDWEYAGMSDPHLDIAMFSIYSGYSRQEIDRLIDCYFSEPCDDCTRLKIYCYVALSGLLWSNWCEYKKVLGVDFGDYARMQYRYAVEYSRLYEELRKNDGGVNP